MSNKNYQRGRAKEYKIGSILRKAGFTVLRTAGSHGFADLIAIRSDGLIRFIQVKPKDFSEKKKEKLLKEHSVFNNEKLYWRTSFEVI